MTDLLIEVQALFSNAKVYECGGFGTQPNVAVSIDTGTGVRFKRNRGGEVSCWLYVSDSVFDPLQTACCEGATADEAWSELKAKIEDVTNSYLDDLRYIRRICNVG